MTSHRPPPPARTPRVVWVIAFGAVVGIVGPPVVALAQTVAPQVAAQTALAWPEQTPEPVGHGGLGGELALPSVGAIAPETEDATSAVRTTVRVIPQASAQTVRTPADLLASDAIPTEAPAASSPAPDETTPSPTPVEAATPVETPAETTTAAPTTTDEPTVTEPSPTTTTATPTTWRHHHHG